MTHSSERELRSLLVEDTDQAIDPTVSEHVENCPHCQAKLSKLSGAGAWTNALVAHLRTLEEPDRELCDRPLLTTIELNYAALQADAAESEGIELEPISLDFLEPAAHPELLGRLGRFDIERMIGSGGMGVVFKAHDGELHRAVAVKVLAPHLAHSGAARKRFAREAQAAAAVIHPNVIPIHNVESDGKLPYLVMQYVAGESLQTRVDRLGPLAIADVLRIAQQTAAGLSAAHAQGLIHRDVKPANILLEESIDRVVLSDFGLARAVDDASLTRTGIVTGTPHYMSPEQAGAELIDCRSDQFSLGCVIYFMLTGRPPFRAHSAMGVLNRICHHPHRPVHEVNAAVPRELSRLVDRLLAKSARARFESATACEAELSSMLAALQSGRLRLQTSHVGTTKRLSSFAIVLAVCASIVLACVLLPNLRPATEGTHLAQEQMLSGAPESSYPPASTSIEQSPAGHLPTTEQIATEQIAGEQTQDPAWLIMQNLATQSATDAWHQSLHELSQNVEVYEQRTRSQMQTEQPWQWLHERSAVADELLHTLDDRLSELQKSLEKLPVTRSATN